jgi:hypothetical protein
VKRIVTPGGARAPHGLRNPCRHRDQRGALHSAARGLEIDRGDDARDWISMVR